MVSAYCCVLPVTVAYASTTGTFSYTAAAAAAGLLAGAAVTAAMVVSV